MDHRIQEFIRQYSQGFTLDQKNIDELAQHFVIVNYPKYHTLLREQEKHEYAYYILQGAARSYYLKDGTEVNTWFAFEQEMIGSLYAYKNLPSRETVELLEDATLLSINMRTLKPLTYSNLQISHIVGVVIEEYAQFLEDRLFYLQFMSSMERYELLLKLEPMALQRIPLTYIASYLGISRETLSRLRAK
jgi:CRP-like cAMP-binding protein